MTSPRRSGSVDGAGHEERGRTALDRLAEVGVAVGALARQGDEELTGTHQARIDGGAADGSVGPCQQPPTGQVDEVVGREGGARPDRAEPG